jgi:hypothetical protein
MHQGATPFFERPVTTGDPEAFVHGVRPSSVSNLSAQPPRFAMRSLVCPSQPRLLSWGDVVRSMVPEGSTWGPHSLHTAEVTGSIPVTPTSTNSLPAPSRSLAVSKSVSKSPTVASHHRSERAVRTRGRRSRPVGRSPRRPGPQLPTAPGSPRPPGWPSPV